MVAILSLEKNCFKKINKKIKKLNFVIIVVNYVTMKVDMLIKYFQMLMGMVIVLLKCELVVGEDLLEINFLVRHGQKGTNWNGLSSRRYAVYKRWYCS